MEKTRPPAQIDDLAGRIALALSNPVRLRVIRALAQREMHVDEIAERLTQSRGNTSAQLKVLHHVGLVERVKRGRQVFFRLTGPKVEALVIQIFEVAAGSTMPDPDVEQMNPRRAREVLARVRRGELVLIDVRSEADFRAAHLPGARSMPLPLLRARTPASLGLTLNVPIAVYCRGRFCADAADAASLLRRAGYEVENLYTSVVELAANGVSLKQGEHSPLRSRPD